MIAFLLLVLIVALVILALRSKDAADQLRALVARLDRVERELRSRQEQVAPGSRVEQPVAAVPPDARVGEPLFAREPAAVRAGKEPPPLPADEVPISPAAAREPAPAKAPSTFTEIAPALNWEAFMGVKLFAWLGGLALFLGLVFFVKYSFENNLVTPQMRIALGAMAGLGLVGGGLIMDRARFAVTVQTLCATGLVTLYGVTFAAHALYGFIPLGAAFAIMAAITAAAFLLAVKLNAQFVAILGLLGGFLTPALLSTGQDQPGALFSYIALLDLGLIAIALRQRWTHLITLAAAGTAILQFGWSITFFTAAKVFTAMAIFGGFEALFLAAFSIAHRGGKSDRATTIAALIAAAAALIFSATLLDHTDLGAKAWIVLSFALAADAALVVLPLRAAKLQPVLLASGAAAFAILGAWTSGYLTDALLLWALGFYLLFALLHTALPLLLRHFSPRAPLPRWVQLFPALGLLLMLAPLLRLDVSLGFWIAVLLVDLVAIALALLAGSMRGVVAVLVLTLTAAGLWMVGLPGELTVLPGLLAVIGGFALLFCGASLFLQQRAAEHPDKREREALDYLPAFSAALPFVLLLMIEQRLPLRDPGPVFGLALLLVIVLLGLARWCHQPILSAVALGCAGLVQLSWLATHFTPATGSIALCWHLAFAAVITLFPFLFQPRERSAVLPWAVAALAFPLHYALLHHVVWKTWPQAADAAMGLLPAILALPLLAGFTSLRRSFPAAHPARLAVLAWFGGATLLFVTLIVPVQLDREWVAVSAAVEGAALLWLFHRLPHPGLRLVGVALLCASFGYFLTVGVRDYNPLTSLPIWNWHFYAYGLVAACCFVGAKLLAPPRDRIHRLNAGATLGALGTILTFLLLNLEITDFYATGPTLTFQLGGNLARDMSYSIAWSLFALLLLLIGMFRRLRAVRLAGIGLLVVTLLKLFLYDLANLHQLYRIGAFIAVAIVLILASYLYQRFLARE